MSYSFELFDEKNQEKWDAFVMRHSINGLFLQTRKFINYHPKNRFEDCSVMIYRKSSLVAVCPACVKYEGGQKVFVSHMGSTYGGILICDEINRLELLFELIDSFEKFLLGLGFAEVILKPTMNIFCKTHDDALNFAYAQKGYREFQELNLYIDYTRICRERSFENLSKLKKRQVRKCEMLGMNIRELVTREEIEEFHSILTTNLKKFGKEPVHTIEELIDLKTNRFSEEIFFYGVFMNNQMLAGTMVFIFGNRKQAHAQYLAALNIDNSISPMSYLYYSILDKYAREGFDILSWGIATEHLGESINWGLMRNKEEFGSKHCINRVYLKNLSGDTYV